MVGLRDIRIVGLAPATWRTAWNWTLVPILAAALCASSSAAETAPGTPSPAAPLIAEARVAQAEGRFAAARDLYERALLADAGAADARTGLAEVAALASGAPASIASETPSTSIHDQLALAEAREAIERAELLAGDGRPDQALAQLDRSRALLAPLVGGELVAREQARVEALTATITRDQRAAQGVDVAAGRREAIDEARIVRAVEAHAQTSVLDERLARILELQRSEDYDTALALCRRLVSDHPGEPRAEQLFAKLIEQVHEQRVTSTKEQDRYLRQEIVERISRSLIPEGFDGRPIFPLDWTARTAERGAANTETALPEWHRRIQQRLAQRLTFRFEDTNFAEALDYLAAQGGFNLIVDPQVLAQGDRTITLIAEGMRIDSALSWLCRMAGTGWSISRQAVYVGPDPENEQVRANYDVAHLVFQAIDQPGRTLSFSSGGGTGTGFDLFGAAAEAPAALAPEDFVDLLQSAVSPKSWTEEGNAIEIRGSTLFVTAPPSVHELVREFVRSESAVSRVVVHVDARWLTINDGFLEEIGVDWGRADSLLRPVGATTTSPGYFHSPGGHTALQGDLINRLPATAVQPNPLIDGTGLYLSFLRIGATQVSAMLHALERKKQGRILARPSLATLNGVRGNVFVGDQVAYIGDYTVVNDVLDPTIEVLNIGATLDIKPYVSADLKYVTMELQPALATYSMFTDVINAPVLVADAFTGFAGYPIELPNVAVRSVGTTVTVPDKATLLVGGFGRHIDESGSSKLPFLGHIPYLGRLFGRRGRYSDRSQLYLLVTVNIITYDEAEAKL